MIVYEELTINSLDDLKELCWSGAIDRIEEVEELGDEQQEKFVNYVIQNNLKDEGITTTTEINDFIWFECDKYINDLKKGIEED